MFDYRRYNTSWWLRLIRYESKVRKWLMTTSYQNTYYAILFRHFRYWFLDHDLRRVVHVPLHFTITFDIDVIAFTVWVLKDAWFGFYFFIDGELAMIWRRRRRLLKRIAAGHTHWVILSFRILNFLHNFQVDFLNCIFLFRKCYKLHFFTKFQVLS